MLVELHILQNFAPSNLNRDDTGSPKSAEFGGYRRARISSQCIKRSIRQEFEDEDLLPPEHLAERTKRVVEEVAKRVGRTAEEARPVVERILAGIDLRLADDGKTQYLLFLGRSELDRLAQLCRDNWEALAPAAQANGATEAPPVGGRARGAGRASRPAVVPPPREVINETMRLLDGGRAADLALFGRMLADLPERNVDAASQVAHAISTHAVNTEFDFYTAVDDLNPDDTAGAGMLGTVEFNSACYYRYSSVHLGQLRHNLGDDGELALRSLGAFVRASVDAVPSGKQNSFAAQNPPSLVLAVARKRHPASLANAFVQPVRPSRERDLVQESVHALDVEWGKITAMYGERGISGAWLAYGGDEELAHLQDRRVPGVDVLIESVATAARGAA